MTTITKLWSLAAAALIPATTLAAGAPAPGAVTAQTVKLPSGPGSVRGLAENAAVSAFTGQVQYAVPVALPAGPGGLTPSLSLGYDGDLGNGPLGVGWTLSQPVIRRSLRLGVPHYDATDEIDVVALGGGGQLVALADGELRVEGQGNAVTGRALDDGYELTDADGRVYRFGTTAAARKASGAKVSSWYLEEVRDVAGHEIFYRYRESAGEVYLDAIDWGPLVDGAPAFRATLEYDPRADTLVSYQTGFRVETAERLTGIDVWSFGALQRVVTIAYEDGFALTRVQAVKVMGASGADALPEVRFTYAAPQAGDVEAVQDMNGWALNLQGTSLFDVDGDGAMDLLRLTASGHSWRRNLGGRFGDPRPLGGAPGATLDGVRLADLDGDSTAEMVRQQGSQWAVFVLDRAARSWAPAGNLAGATNLPLGGVVIADVDGDRRMDVLSVSGSTIQLRRGTAAGVSAPEPRPAIDPARSFIYPGAAGASFPDINGDGVADVVYQAGSSLYLYLGRGDGTFEKYRDVAFPFTDTVGPSQIHLGDLNRDGLLDLVLVRAGNVSWFPGRADGTFDAQAVERPRPPGTDAAVVVTLADIDGNGSEDLVWSSPAGMWIVDFAGPTSAGMLTRIENGLGQEQQFGYQASTELMFQASVPWTRTMPVSIPVAVTSRILLASGEPARSSRVDVRDGLYDVGERRFIGFAESTVTRPDPADAAMADTIREVTRYAAGSGMERVLRGEIVYQRIEDGTGKVYTETANEVAAVAVAGLPADDARLRRAVVRSTETRHFEGQATPLVTRDEYDFDDEGRTVEDRHLGRVDLSGDESTIRRRYTAGRSAQGVRDRVCDEQLVTAAGAVLSDTQILYGDDRAVAPLCDAGAGWSRLTRQQLAEESRWVTTSETSYTADGLPLDATRGGVTRHFSYDPEGLHPVAEEVEPEPGRTLRWEMTWDPTLQQPARVLDADGSAMVPEYDGLGRLRSLRREGSAAHVHTLYHLAGPRPWVETFTYDGPSDAVPPLPESWTAASRWRHAVSVSNSAGEELFAATRIDATRWLVSGRRQRDAIGRTVAVADSYELAGTLAELLDSAEPTGTPVRTVAYDTLDRPVTQTLANGAQSRHAYRAFATTVTTDGLAPVSTFLDGQARVVRTERTVNGVVEAVEASYDAAGRITEMRLPRDGAIVTHQFHYDTLGRLVSATDPDIGARALDYDDAGRLVAQTNGAGQTTAYDYDGAGRLRSVTAEDGSEYVFHYDEALDAARFPHTAGRLAWVAEPTGRVEHGYDALGRIVRTRREVHGRSAEQEMTYSASGLVLETHHGDGSSLDVEYDAAGRAIRVGDLWALESQDAAGRILREHFGNGVVQTYERDVLGQPSRLQVLRPAGAPMYDVTIGRNPMGLITRVTDLDGTGLNHTAAFEYDGGARLTDAVVGGGDRPYHFAYRYDGLSNMIRREASGPAALAIVAGEYRYGEPGAGGAARGPRQLTSVVPDAAGAPATTFDYDAAGRVVRQGERALRYNGFDQLVEVGVPGGDVVYAYGHDGVRVSSLAPGGLETRRFTPDVSEMPDGTRELDVRLGDRLIARVSLTADVGTSAAAALAQALRLAAGVAALLLFVAVLLAPRRGRRRAWITATGSALPWMLLVAGCDPRMGVASQALGATTRTIYYHTVVGAGPSLITRSDGSVLDERRYEPFGAGIDAYRELAGGGSETGPVDFVRDPHNILNKESDPATGWSDHGARWLAPETGRWLTPDPPVKAPDPSFMVAPWALHPYQYVHQNPVLYWDPDGKQPALKEVVERAVEAVPTLSAAARAARKGWKVIDGGAKAAAAGGEAAAGAFAAGVAAFAAVTFYPRTLADATCNRRGACKSPNLGLDGAPRPDPRTDRPLPDDRDKSDPMHMMTVTLETSKSRWARGEIEALGEIITDHPISVTEVSTRLDEILDDVMKTGVDFAPDVFTHPDLLTRARLQVDALLDGATRSGGVSDVGMVFGVQVNKPGVGQAALWIKVYNLKGTNLLWQ